VSRKTWIWLWSAAGIAVGLAAEYFSIHAHTPENHLLDLVVGWAFIGAGLVAWWRRPENRIGPLMAAVGFTWFIGNFGNASQPVVYSLGSAFESVSAVVLAHVVLAYPEGKLGRPERAMMIVGYTWILGTGVVKALTFDPSSFLHCDCPHGGLAFLPSKTAYDTVNSLENVIGVLFSLTVFWLLIRRYVRSTPAMRRLLRPLWVASALTALVIVSNGVSNAVDEQSAAATVTSVLQRVAELLVPIALLYGLFRSRLAQSAVADLVTELAQPMPPGRLREVLARTLGDTSLQLVYWLEDAGEFVDEDGRPIEVSRLGDRRAVTALEADGRPLAAMIHDPGLLVDPGLIDAVAAAARLALENERLQAEIRAQLEEVRASRARIVQAGDAERRRVERDLHDGAQQRLVTLSLALRMALEQLNGADPEVRATLEEASGELARALAELRELARGIHPSILTEAGLGPALESLAERSTIAASVVATPIRRLPEEVEASAYFVVSESLANAAKHSGARSVRIGARVDGGWLLVEVVDDGVGGADPSGGSGLRGLADRVAAVNGRLTVRSPAGGGTRIEAAIPCA